MMEKNKKMCFTKGNGNMQKIAWITDSTCGLPEEFIAEHNIYVVPLSVIVNGVSYKDNVDITSETFYEKLKEHGEGAMTSQPAYGEFLRLYKKLKETYDIGVAIHASSALTGTYNSSKNAAKEVGFNVEVIDSKMGSYALGKMIRNGIKLEQSGKSYEAIVETIKGYTTKTEMYLLPESFSQLKKSGRVSTAQAIFATLLKINLLLRFEDGKVVVADKIRTKKRAENRLLQIITDTVNEKRLKEICIMHAGVKERALHWKKEIGKLHEQLKIKIEALVPVAGVHTGFGTMAVSWLYD